jgi:hypothetical protein
MSRKHYRAFAENIAWEVKKAKEMRKGVTRNAVTAVIETMADDLARTCKRDNPNFRYATFFAACGLDANGKVVK